MVLGALAASVLAACTRELPDLPLPPNEDGRRFYTPPDAGPDDDDEAERRREMLVARCAEAPALENLRPVDGNTTGAPSVVDAQCVPGNLAEQLFRYTVLGGSDVVHVRLTPRANADLGLAVRTECGQVATEIGCVDEGIEGDDEHLSFHGLEAGTELIIVVEEAYTNVGGFSLVVEEVTYLEVGAACDPGARDAVCAPSSGAACLGAAGAATCQTMVSLDEGDACDADNTAEICDDDDGLSCFEGVCTNLAVAACDAIIELTPGEAFVGDTAAMFNGLDACVGASAPEFVFAFPVTGDGRVVRAVLTPAEGVDLGLYRLVDCESRIPAACRNDAGAGGAETLEFADLPAGTAVFVVDGHDGHAGSFSLLVDEVVPEVLATGAACVPDSLSAPCDTAAGDLCELNSSGVYTCQNLIPAHDTCEGAFLLGAASGTLSGTRTYAFDDYGATVPGESASCTGFSSRGRDVVFAMDLLEGETVTLSLQTQPGDASLYVYDRCPPDVDACAAGADDLSGATETLEFEVDAEGRYFVVVDSFTQGGEAYTLSWTRE